MDIDVYERLARVLSSLPNGFPRTGSGVELQILKKIFRPREAELFSMLKLRRETAREIAVREGFDPVGLEHELGDMWHRGLVECDPSGPEKKYNLVPWILGLYELQAKFIDEEFARLHAKYIKTVGPYFLSHRPQMMQVVPIEREIVADHEAMPYERVSSLIDRCVSFAVSGCVCKKQMSLLERECSKPREVCIAMSEKPGFYDDNPLIGRVISKDEARDILRAAEEAGLVHMTGNTRRGHYFICNCCCVQLIAARFGMKGTVNSRDYAVIDPALCKNCGLCSDSRCQVKAIDAVDADKAHRAVNGEKCIGCGLCASTCPVMAVSLMRRDDGNQDDIPEDETDWYRRKAREQGIDITPFE